MASLQVLGTFVGSNGSQPVYGSFVADASGNLYGTTAHGGTNGNGVVYEISYDSTTGTYGAPTTLASFTDGGNPYNTLYMDASRNLYGAAYTGGSGVGSIFELPYDSANGIYGNTLTTLASFSYAYPNTSLIADASGNFYGTTSVGGTDFSGSVFEFRYDGTTRTYSNTPTTLASFQRATDGYSPFAGLIADKAGNLYGTTSGGGDTPGTVFELTYNGATGTYSTTPTTLARFDDTSRGQGPNSGLLADSAGNLYGTTYGGGANNAGQVFELVRDPITGAFTTTTLASFDTTHGAGPTGALIADAAGNLYGTTSAGGANGDGTVFKLAYDSTTGTYSDTPTTLATFDDANNGRLPYGGLHADAAGNLIGTTSYGGTDNLGTVFEVTGSGFVTACFASGTLIRTTRGDVAVEALVVGDVVVMVSDGHRPIRWIGHRDLDCTASDKPDEAWPIRILAGAFGDERPERDLLLSPGHPVLVGSGRNEHLVPIMCLINGTSIARVPVATVTYWHVELDAHDILLAEGLPVESFLDFGNRPWFGPDAAAHALANPEFIVPGLGARCRPVAIDGLFVERERRRLDAIFATSLVAPCAWPDATGSVGFDI